MKGTKLFSTAIRTVAVSIVFQAGLLLLVAAPARSQSFVSQDRERGVTMLKTVKEDIKKNYYDPGFRGIDIDARFKLSEDKMKLTKSNAEVFGIIAQTLLEFNDSHTSYVPPQRSARIDYGWLMKTFGDDCYVTEVKPHSDAYEKGLRPGDRVQSIDGIRPNKANLWIFYYLYYQLAPRPIVKMLVQSPGEQPRQLEIKPRIQTGKKTVDLTDTIDLNRYWREEEDADIVNAHRFKEFGSELFVWKMPHFDLIKDGVDEMVDKAKKHKALILDLRGNGGGAEETLLRLIGNFSDHDVTVGDVKRRKETKPLVAKTRGASGFKGQLVILVDSDSASASEVFARVMQMEKRGTVLGDRTAGKVMRSRLHVHQMGLDTVVLYAASVTDADIVMSDGKSLEQVGVTPDELSLPTGENLRARQDPVLSRAAALLGVKLDPVDAGKLFPFRWMP
jgi:C-terminal processing protease CtpA/Prc